MRSLAHPFSVLALHAPLATAPLASLALVVASLTLTACPASPPLAGGGGGGGWFDVGEGEVEPGDEGEGEEGEGEGGPGGDEGEGDSGGEEGEGEAPAVVMNEIDCHGQDHVELLTTPNADLTGVVIAEGLSDYVLPPGSRADADGRFIVDEEETAEDGTVSAGFPFEIECADRTVTLSFDGVPLDSASLPAFPGSFEGTSLCRIPDETGPFVLCTPTMGAANEVFVDPDGVLFDPLQVVTIDLTIDQAGISSLTTSPREYVEGTFQVTVAGRTYGPVSAGIAIKGNEAGSFRPLSQKSAFKVKFNEFEPGNRFLGLKGLKLNNMVEDDSYLHEAVSYSFFRQLGVPAARAGYSRVLLNGNDYGLHATIERVDDVFASRHFSDTQHIYEGGVLGVDVIPCSAPCAAGDPACRCVDGLEVDAGDDLDRTDVNALAEAATSGSGTFMSSIQSVLDVPTSARTWIASQYLYHWDGYAGGRNNFYLHSDDDGVFTFIPSGLDGALNPEGAGLDASYPLKTGQTPFAGGDDAQGLLFSQCRDVPACNEQLDAAIDDVAALVASWDAVALLDDIRPVIEPYVASDPRRVSTVTLDEVHAAQDATRSLLLSRVSVVQ